METTRTKTSRADQDTGAAIVGIYALGAGALEATVFLADPECDR